MFAFFGRDANHCIYSASVRTPRSAAPRRALPRLASVMSPMAPLLLLMPTRSFCSETHQSLCRLIGSERWESVAVCTPPPKSGTTLNTPPPGAASHQRVPYQQWQGGWEVALVVAVGGGGEDPEMIGATLPSHPCRPEPPAVQRHGARWRFA